MSWGLDVAAGELAAELKQAELKVVGYILVTQDAAIKMIPGKPSAYYRKILKDTIDRVAAAKKAKLQARQTSFMLELEHEDRTQARQR